MKKPVAMVLVVVMMLALGVTAFAAKGPLTVEEAKQVALDYAGVKAADANFTKAHRDFDNVTGKVTDFSKEYHAVYNPPVTNTQPSVNSQTTVTYYGYYDDDPYDYDLYDDDLFDLYDFYDYDYDDMYDFD